ncbi:MAG: DNA-binding domain-containing protein [Gammaproteobacteria bacterium]|nr:DNA-binding domain-containing protein [Gammaproteobacteria bacterium]
MGLKEIQEQFSSALLDTSETHSLPILPGTLQADQRIQIYRNNFYISLSEVLSGVFPVTHALVGETFFAQLCKAFIRQHPPAEGSVTHYGADLPGFIARLSQAESTPYLADVARLEWAYAKVNEYWKVGTPFPFEKLALVAPEEWPNILFKLAKNVHLICSDFSVLDIVNGVRNDCLEDVVVTAPQQIVISGGANQEVQCEAVSSPEYAFLETITRGIALGETSPPPDFEAFLKNMIITGVIDDFEMLD